MQTKFDEFREFSTKFAEISERKWVVFSVEGNDFSAL